MIIGIVCYPTYGGSGIVATELGKHLASIGHLVHFISTRIPVRLNSFQKNIIFHEVETVSYPLFDHIPFETLLTSKLVDVILKNNLDVLHVHYAIPYASIAYLTKKILKDLNKKILTVTTLHGTDITLVGKDKAYTPVVEFSINNSDYVTSVSNWLKDETYKNFKITKEIKVIPNFVDAKFYSTKTEINRNDFAKPNEKIICHASNFREVKRIPDIVNTFYKVNKKVPSKLILLGDGVEKSKIETLVNDLGIKDRVIFLGNQQNVKEILGISDLYYLFSIESFGLSALEAMACGIPVLSACTGGTQEFNINGKTGFCCEVGNIDEFANKSLEILLNPNFHKELSLNCIETSKKYACKKIIPEYISLYENGLKNIDK